MNFLKRAVTSHLSQSSRPGRRCLPLLRPVARSSMYSTAYKLTNTDLHRQPRTTRESPSSSSSSSSSSLSFAQRVRKQGDGFTDWARPSEIPYQAKVANLVNLVGQITTPVKFQMAPNGKSLAGAVLSQENGQSFVIPVVFEGDLAHVVASHVKENDSVYVVGRLSEDPLPFVLGKFHGNFHLVVDDINFVQGFEKKTKNVSAGSSLPQKRIFKNGNDDDTAQSFLKAPEPEVSEINLFQDSLKSDNEEEKNGGDTGNDHWSDLVKNRDHWRDFREKKAKGLVKEKYPDFKHKENNTPLWLNSAPNWVLQELQNSKKGSCVKDAARGEAAAAEVPSKWGSGGGKSGGEDCWKSLVENPSKWWDNRSGKKNARAPDFKHKETGEVLWLNSSPSWVLPLLPPLKEKKAF